MDLAGPEVVAPLDERLVHMYVARVAAQVGRRFPVNKGEDGILRVTRIRYASKPTTDD